MELSGQTHTALQQEEKPDLLSRRMGWSQNGSRRFVGFSFLITNVVRLFFILLSFCLFLAFVIRIRVLTEGSSGRLVQNNGVTLDDEL